MVLDHPEAWSSEQLQAGIVRNPADIIVWCHSMVSKYDREREAVKAWVIYAGDRRSCHRGTKPPLSPTTLRNSNNTNAIRKM